MSERPQKIAFIGARGIGRYGGFETFVSEMTPRLRQKGMDVSCSSRRPAEGEPVDEYKGVRISYFPFRFPRSSKAGRAFEILYDWYFALRYSFAERADVLYCLGIAPGLISPLIRLSGTKLVINIDGVEWQRAKFSLLERGYIRISYMAAYLGSHRILLDNARLMRHVPSWVQRKAVVIPYGVAPPLKTGWRNELLLSSGKPGIESIGPGGYWLVVARLEPENSIHLIVEAFAGARTEAPLLIVGEFSTDSYRRKVERLVTGAGHSGIRLVGSIYDKELLDMLRVNCLGYIHGHTVGGTNPSLLEAMACGNLIVAHDNEFNREVAGDGALYFSDVESLTSVIDNHTATDAESERLGQVARSRSERLYSWDSIVDSYASLIDEIR